VDYEKQAQSIYALCDIFVLPSPVEGTPLVLLEAMASGKPVIATDTGGVSGIIDDGRNGFIIEPKDILGLKERILLLLNSGDLRRRIGEAARAKMVERFSWDKIADDMLKIYSALAGR
jgi:glycosyltransferase involved in cell wall biosynthesis